MRVLASRPNLSELRERQHLYELYRELLDHPGWKHLDEVLQKELDRAERRAYGPPDVMEQPHQRFYSMGYAQGFRAARDAAKRLLEVNQLSDVEKGALRGQEEDKG